MFKKLLVPTLISSLLLPAMANAESENETIVQQEDFFYVGARSGLSIYHDLCIEGTINCEDQDVGYSGFVGYQFNDWFALELILGSYGSPDIERTVNDQTVRTTDDVLGGELTAKIIGVEVGDDLDVYARLGAAYQEVSSSSEYDDLKLNRTGGVAAIGLEYDLTDQLSARAEYEYIHFIGDEDKVFEDDSMEFASLGLSYKFRDSEPVALPPTPAPAPEPEPEPEPVVVRIDDSQGVEAIFDFDSAKLNDVSRLEPIIEALSNATGDITIRAHTDSIGSDEYNQRLSEKRAQSAVDYFTGKGIDKSRLRAIGMGEGHPVKPNTTKEGRAQNRRLEIEYTIEKVE